MVSYKVESAKSGRSKCAQKIKSAKICENALIDKGDLRVGSTLVVGPWYLGLTSYGRWRHLMCWRVPSKIWLRLPDPGTCQIRSKFEEALSSMKGLFIGFDALSPAEKDRIIDHVMDKSHWAKLTPRKRRN